MASSSHEWNYDVYISFRGEDTRKTFVGHLYAALHKRGINTYLDTETLPHGVPIEQALFKAVEESRVTLVVFSKNYAQSHFCLEELRYILYCKDARGQIVVPIFYDVEPSEVRNQSWSYREALLYHESTSPSEVEIWRKALKDASNLCGWDMKTIAGGYEAKGIQLIVGEISNLLFPINDQGIHLQDHKFRGGDSGYDNSKQINALVASSFSKTHPSELANHDVFLSFRGDDTRHNFVDHLYSALEEHEILTYNDTGSNIIRTPSIDSRTIKAIEESRISIVIFSKNYAQSSYLMDELAYIMKCKDEKGHIVIPLFYHVDPSTVRHSRGEYRDAFSRHMSMNPSKVELWKNTLRDASSLNGWDLRSIADGHEAKCIQLIVKKISNILFPDKDLIGLHTRVGDVKYGGGGMISIPPSSHQDLKHLKIPLHEIIRATNNFSKNNFITTGGFGKVYRGQSEKLGTVVVKKLDRSHGQGDHEFMMEITLLSTYKHENIVSLVGYCFEDEERILVLKYEIKGSLEEHLHNKDLTWIQRLRICLDAANGLKHLHEAVGAQHRIIHRDVKSSNILLDENWKAKISDFGLSKITLANVPCSVIFSQACGTLGYIDPQYQDHNHLSQKSDVYSFGVVLFEVLCSKSVNARQYHFSAQLAKNHYEKGTLDEIIDSGLRSQMNSDCLRTYSSIAYQCLMIQRDERPTMGRVVDQLEKALDYQEGSSGSWHDVYICFRHRDPECHVVDNICAALHQGNVSTYKDEVTLSRNESVLLKAIKHSHLFVILFTKKFAVNSWYLDEVANIIECMKEKRQIILPVFLNVSRSDVQTQKGYFGEVMSEYDRHPRMEVWRNALVEATNSPGLEYSKFRSSADFVKKVVEDIKIGLSAEFLSTLQV